MKITRLALTLGATLLSSVAFAGAFTINPTPAPIAAGPAGATTPAAIAFVYTPGAADATIGFQASIAFNTAQVSATVANGAGANGTGGNCVIASPGVIRIIAADNNNVALQAGTYCNLTFTSTAAFTTGTSALPITITGGGKGCFDLNGAATTCTKTDGSLAVTVVGVTAPTATIAATSTLTAGAGTVAVNVATPGNAGGSLALACTIPATGASAFAITAGANRTITGPAALGANAPAIGLSCVPQAAAVNATLSCAQTPTPAAALPALTSVVTCPAGGPTITPTPAGGTAAAPVTLTIANGTAQPVGTVVNITGLTVTGAGFVAPATGSWGACTYSADATPPAATTSDPTAFTAGPQLVFNSTNNATAQPQVLGGTRRAGQVSAILTCPVLPAGTAPGSTTNVYRLVLAAGAPVATAVAATTPASGSTTVLAPQAFGGGTSTQVLTFTSTGAGTMNCAVTPASPGYSVTPVVTLTAAGPNTATVTFTGTTSGTFLGTVVCTPVAPATGGPFTYNFSTTVAGAPVPQIQVPALGNISLMLLIAGFLGLGAVLVGRRQA